MPENYEELQVNNVPSTLICSKATEDIKNFLEQIRREQNLSADLMCMILRDACSYFERMRANDYAEGIIQQIAQIDYLKKENEALKQQITEILNNSEAVEDDKPKD